MKMRLLVDTRKFNALHWEKRRTVLMDLVEEVSREDIVEKESQLKALELDGKDIDERRKQLKSRASEIDKELDEIPIRIDQAKKEEPETEEDLEGLQSKLEDLKGDKKEIEEKIADLKSSGQEAELRKEIGELENEIEDFERSWEKEIEEKLDDNLDERRQLERVVEDKEAELKRKRNRKEELEDKVTEGEEQIEELGEDWKELKARSFPEDKKTCPTCGQKLPEEDIEEKRKEFRRETASKLSENEEKGRKLRANLEDWEEELSELGGEIEALQSEIEDKEGEIKATFNREDELQGRLDKYTEQEEYQDLREKLEEKRSELEEGQDSEAPEKVLSLQEELSQVEDGIEWCRDGIAELKAYQKTLEDIEELKAKEDRLTTEYEEVQNQLRLIDLYTETKANMLEESINKKFDLVSFKLFERQVNGKVVPTCQTLVEGVSWDSTLNNGAMVKGGLDIVETLGEYYGVKLPVWIDNAESVTGLPDLVYDLQLIELIVEEGVEELEVSCE